MLIRPHYLISNYFVFPKHPGDDKDFKCVHYVYLLPEIQHSFHACLFRQWSLSFSTSLAMMFSVFSSLLLLPSVPLTNKN